jgi:hypothetical protein
MLSERKIHSMFIWGLAASQRRTRPDCKAPEPALPFLPGFPEEGYFMKSGKFTAAVAGILALGLASAATLGGTQSVLIRPIAQAGEGALALVLPAAAAATSPLQIVQCGQYSLSVAGPQVVSGWLLNLISSLLGFGRRGCEIG